MDSDDKGFLVDPTVGADLLRISHSLAQELGYLLGQDYRRVFLRLACPALDVPGVAAFWPEFNVSLKTCQLLSTRTSRETNGMVPY